MSKPFMSRATGVALLQREPPSSPSGHRPWDILIVGPATAYRDNVHQALDALRPSIEIVPDVATACQCLARQPYDLIMILLPLQGSDTVTACQQVRDVDRRVPLLALDMAGTIDAELAGLAAGADMYLLAPLSAEELRARCSALLRRSRDTVAPHTTRSGDILLPLPIHGENTPLLDARRVHPFTAVRTWVTRLFSIVAVVLSGAASIPSAKASSSARPPIIVCPTN